MRNIEVQGGNLQNVMVVNESPNVFLQELLGLPPKGKLSFVLIWCQTQLISIPSYYIVPIELKELKDQLKDLLDKGFV